MSHLVMIADRMRAFRFRHRLTQEEAADLSGLTVKHWQKIEAKKTKVMFLETLEKIADGMGIEPSELIGGAEPETHPAFVATSAVHTDSPRNSYGLGRIRRFSK